MLEVLAPAGDLTRLKTAVDFGAHAVYFAAKEFGMRAAPGNFSFDEIKIACDYAHARGAAAYLTLNTLPRNEEIARIGETVTAAAAAGIDAFIVTDLGLIEIVKKHAPETDLHISVQTGIVNYAAANFYYNLGAKRVVMARELSLTEIAEIRSKTPAALELEAFVHGAICMSVSGRCLISDYLTGRDPNRGDCSQPCRWKYSLVEETRPGQYMDIVENETGSYILNAKDMCMIEHISALADAGISCFKIEGRAKTEYYTAVTSNAYRKAVDGYLKNGSGYKPEQEIVDELDKISHRTYSTGFYFGRPNQVQETGGYIRNYELIGIAESYADGYVTIRQRNKFYPGTIDVLEAGKGSFLIEVGKLFDEDMKEIEAAPHPNMRVRFQSPPIKPGSFLRVKK